MRKIALAFAGMVMVSMAVVAPMPAANATDPGVHETDTLCYWWPKLPHCIKLGINQ